MDDHYITIGELALLVGLFVGPFLLAGALTQFLLLRQARLRAPLLVFVLVVAAVLTVLLTWGLMFVVPSINAFGYGGAFMWPALIAVVVVSTCVALLARFRRSAA